MARSCIFTDMQGAAKNVHPRQKNCNFSELAGYFTGKFCTIILKGWLHQYYTFHKILLICIVYRNDRIWNTKYDFISRQAAAVHLLNNVPKQKKLNLLKTQGILPKQNQWVCQTLI